MRNRWKTTGKPQRNHWETREILSFGWKSNFILNWWSNSVFCCVSSSLCFRFSNKINCIFRYSWFLPKNEKQIFLDKSSNWASNSATVNTLTTPTQPQRTEDCAKLVQGAKKVQQWPLLHFVSKPITADTCTLLFCRVSLSKTKPVNMAFGYRCWKITLVTWILKSKLEVSPIAYMLQQR